MAEWIAFERGICTDLHSEIDGVFGDGVSAMVFGDSVSLDPIMQFFDEITPYIDKAANERTKKYTNRAQRRALKK